MPRGNNGLRLRGAYCRHRERTLQALQRLYERLLQRRARRDLLPQEVRYYLGVRLGVELETAGLELIPKLRVVLDDAVVHDRDLGAYRRPATQVGVGVRLGRAPVRSPTRVPDPGAHAEKVTVTLLDNPREVIEGAYLPRRPQPVRPSQGQPGRVISPVLEVPQPLHEHLYAPLPANVTHDPTHKEHLPALVTGRQKTPLPGNPKANRKRKPDVVTGLGSAFCPRRHRRDLPPPYRPPECRDASAEKLDERLPRQLPGRQYILQRALALCFLPASPTKLSRVPSCLPVCYRPSVRFSLVSLPQVINEAITLSPRE